MIRPYIYPGHPMVIALAIVDKYPSLSMALEKSQGHEFCNALGDCDIPGAGGCVSNAIEWLIWAIRDKMHWEDLLERAADMWARTDDQFTKNPGRWIAGQEEANRFADELQTKLEAWKP